MPSYATLSNVDKILKEYTEGTGREELMAVQAPTLALFKKDTGYGGKVKPLPFEYAPIAGISPSFPAAQASKEDASEDAWQITTDDMYALWSLDHKAMWMTRNDKLAFIELVEARAKSAMMGFRKVVAQASYGNGSGWLAQITANDGAGTLTLSPNGSMRIFDKGMYIQPSLVNTATGGAVINDIQQIATVNRNTRQITAVSGNFPIANYAVNSYVFLRGGFQRYVKGISAWVPDATPSATAFFGVNRLQDSRLYGVSYTPTADDANAEEGLITLGEKVHEQGGESDLLLCHPAFKTAVRKILGNKVEYDKLSGTRSDGSTAEISFRTIKIALDSGDVDMISDYNCPRNRAYLLQKDTWTWVSAGEMPMRLKYGDDDKNYARHGTENAMEARLGAYFQLACTFPGANGVMLVPDEWLAAVA